MSDWNGEQYVPRPIRIERSEDIAEEAVAKAAVQRLVGVHDGVPPQVTKWQGGNATLEWPICPGCGGRMQRKRRRCTKCRAQAAREAAAR